MNNFGTVFRRKPKSKFNPNQEFVHNAVGNFLKSGGKITKIELNYELLMAGRNEVTADDFLRGE